MHVEMISSSSRTNGSEDLCSDQSQVTNLISYLIWERVSSKLAGQLAGQHTDVVRTAGWAAHVRLTQVDKRNLGDDIVISEMQTDIFSCANGRRRAAEAAAVEPQRMSATIYS